MSNSKVLWQQKLTEVGKLRDEVGNGIDEGIKETVAALQLLGLHTMQSCEGHRDRGKQPAPWVDIESPDVRALRARMWELEEKLGTLAEEDEEHERVRQELHQVMQEVKRREALEVRKIVPYLDAFYRERQVPYDRRIIVDRRLRLTIQGSILQAAEDEDTRARKLQEYQQEMHAFTAFLKRKLSA